MVGRTTGHHSVKLAIVPANEEDVDTVIRILSDVARWLGSRGLPSRWGSALDRDRFLAQIRLKEVHLARIGPDIVGTITLQWADPVFWSGASNDAGYIHKFAVIRDYAGRRIGEEMLRWAENRAVLSGKKYLRLDCLATNKIIRSYYERAGYVHKGDVSPMGWVASLYEKRLSGDTGPGI